MPKWLNSQAIIKWIRNFNNVRDELESLLVDFISGVVPWLAPIAPSYVAYSHMRTILLFPWYIAFPLACVIEGLGFGAIHTAVRLHIYNKTKADKIKSYAHANVRGAVLSVGGYLAIILSLNVVLALVTPETLTLYSSRSYLSLVPYVANAFAIFLLSLMTLVAGYVVSLRTQHKEYLAERKQLYAKDTKPVVVTAPLSVSQQAPFVLDKQRKTLLDYYAKHPHALDNISNTARDTGFSRPSIYKWTGEFRDRNLITVDDNGSGKQIRVL